MTDRSKGPPAPNANAERSGSQTTGSPSGGSGSRGPSGAPRAGRRATQRPAPPEPSFLERRRGLLLGGLAVVVVALVGVFLFFGSTQKAYACTQLTAPGPAATPAPDSSTAPLGQAQDDMGRRHVDAGASVRYTYCPPASGPHYNAPDGPIPARYYGKDEAAVPQGWIHNLEHGGIAILYSCTVGSCDKTTEDTLRKLVATFPPSPVCAIPAGGDGPAPVVARFDDMQTPFAALVWGRLLLLDSLDTAQILAFYQEDGERTNPEPQCAAPSPSPGASTNP